VYQNNYLQFQQNMFYDFLFWDYADQIYSQEHLEFTPQAIEIIDLSINSAGQYTNANMLNGFAAENIGLITGAAAEYIKATIYNYESLTSELTSLTMAATADYIQTTVYNFVGLTSELTSLTMGATAEHIEAHLFNGLAPNNISLNIQAISQYQNINGFKSKGVEPIDFEHWATLLVTTEPRNNIGTGELNFKLKIVNWVYFESDIYKPTYKLEITKPNTLWEPTEQDRPLVEANQRPRQGVNIEDTIFGGQDEFKIDRRILSLTDIGEPTQISYASEIKKPNTLYTKNNDYERGLMDD
jgi:hypothetical protein